MLRKPLGAARSFFIMGRCTRRRAVAANSAAHDMTFVLQAECGDCALSSAALTTSADVVQQSPAALLNNVNRPFYVYFLLLLRRRGAIRDSRIRQEIARFLVPSVHFDLLQWLWGVGAGEGATFFSGQKQEVEGDSVASLRTMQLFDWRTAVERNKPLAPGEQLHYWHQVFFAVAANQVFGEAANFDSAHKQLLALIRDYYSDVLHVQQFLPSLGEGVVLTRMPPVLLRKLRKFYVNHYCLLLYAELFRAVVDGEELVVPMDCTTALLNDPEVFEYYLTIPGRRESGLQRDVRWTQTLEYATFAFQKLFRQQRWQGSVVGVGLERPAMLFMNACVFARNDNAEGERYREAILAVMRVFYAEYGNNIDAKATARTECDVLRVLRDTGVESMLAKCKRLHFGPIRGLLNVCTVATVTEILLCSRESATNEVDQIGFCRDGLEILLSPRKLIVDEIYDTAQEWYCERNVHSNSFGLAALYGLMGLGGRIRAALVSVVRCPASVWRYNSELEKWCLFIGRPLRLDLRDVSSFDKTLPLSEFSGRDLPPASWRCGCNSLNIFRLGCVACISCVSRTFVRHAWTCPYCLWLSKSGDRIDTCLGCKRPHPSLAFVKDESRDSDNCYDSIPATDSGVPSLTSPFWYCELCLSYSFLAYNAADETAKGCTECGVVGRGWSTGSFVWRCGCGELNSPLRRWCGACSFGSGYACCTCVRCRERWRLQSYRMVAGRDVCPLCKEAHPRDIAAWRRQLLRCPFCHSLTPSAVEVCNNCKRGRGVLGQFLARLSDWPWSCHACGQRHQHRGPEGAFYPTPRDIAAEACARCGVLRPDPVLFDAQETWSCAKCGKCVTRGFSCKRCLALHPAIPAAEVRAWRCVVCRSVNSSWHSACQRPGCGTRRTADSTELPYTPWQCPRCGEYSRSTQVPQCERCGAVRPVVARVAHENAGGTAEERRARRLAEVEALLLASAAAASDEEITLNVSSFGCVQAEGRAPCVDDALRLALPLR